MAVERDLSSTVGQVTPMPDDGTAPIISLKCCYGLDEWCAPLYCVEVTSMSIDSHCVRARYNLSVLISVVVLVGIAGGVCLVLSRNWWYNYHRTFITTAYSSVGVPPSQVREWYLQYRALPLITTHVPRAALVTAMGNPSELYKDPDSVNPSLTTCHWRFAPGMRPPEHGEAASVLVWRYGAAAAWAWVDGHDMIVVMGVGKT
jgi:hypothetical protein